MELHVLQAAAADNERFDVTAGPYPNHCPILYVS
jgi:hypothetical protein